MLKSIKAQSVLSHRRHSCIFFNQKTLQCRFENAASTVRHPLSTDHACSCSIASHLKLRAKACRLDDKLICFDKFALPICRKDTDGYAVVHACTSGDRNGGELFFSGWYFVVSRETSVQDRVLVSAARVPREVQRYSGHTGGIQTHEHHHILYRAVRLCYTWFCLLQYQANNIYYVTLEMLFMLVLCHCRAVRWRCPCGWPKVYMRRREEYFP